LSQARLRPLRVLLSEGSTTSAREAVTALGLAGHAVEICDPDAHCIARFSRFVRRYHRCPGLRVDPEGYARFMLDLVRRERFDVLLPIHEQGFLLSRLQGRFTPHAALALPSFDAYAEAHSKAGFSRLLTDLRLPQPRTVFVASPRELMEAASPPAVVKAAIGTASRGTWMIETREDLRIAARELEETGGFDDEVLVQELVEGPIEHAQAVFARGRLVGLNVYRQIARGAGGGPALKASVRRPQVRADLSAFGARLAWHGALSVDYILREADDVPAYIDCNPRLVEPMSAGLSGLDLADLLVRVSLGEEPEEVAESREGVRTHLALQALIGRAMRGGSRGELARECWRLLAHAGPYAGSREELTPWREDPPSVVPLVFAALWLLANPNAARTMTRRGWGSHLLDARSARIIRTWSESGPTGL